MRSARQARSGSGPEEIQENLTAMLDVLFNILAFFVITYQPNAAEKNFDVALPVQKVEKADGAKSDIFQPDIEPPDMPPINIYLSADDKGALTAIRIEGAQLAGGVPELVRALQRQKVESATVLAVPGLKYRHLIAVVDACYQANVKKINFSEPK